MKPLAIDIFCGLGGWTEGLLAEGYYVVGFDIERHVYGEHQYPAQLVIQDVRTIHGSQFRDAALIVASPPCQEYSYMAMPWQRAKQIARALRGEGDFPAGYKGSRTISELNALFDACFRIQREAGEAAGRHIPLVVENVKGAQPWVGRARWSYGSYYLWGDVPALMPTTLPRRKSALGSWDVTRENFVTGTKAWALGDGVKAGDRNKGRRDGSHKWMSDFAEAGQKNTGGSWFNIGSPGQKVVAQNPVHEGVRVASESGRRTDVGKGARFTSRDCGVEGVKIPGHTGRAWFAQAHGKSSSKSSARKAASARIAKIPLTLARHIAHVYRGGLPDKEQVA